MNKSLTDVTILLDSSGSMNTIANDMIGAINSYYDAQKLVPGYMVASLITFNTGSYHRHYSGMALNCVPNLTSAAYHPNGGTPLLDSIGKCITETGSRLAALPEYARPGKVIIVIVTDGEENDSKEYRHHQISAMITHQQNTYSWEFVFLGANQDAIKVASSYCIPSSHSITYSSNTVGVSAVGNSLSYQTSIARGGGTLGFTDEDRAKQASAGTK